MTAKPAAKDRSMAPDAEQAGEVFFFPKRNPPVSIRAASLAEAEAKLEALNRKEHD